MPTTTTATRTDYHNNHVATTASTLQCSYQECRAPTACAKLQQQYHVPAQSTMLSHGLLCLNSQCWTFADNAMPPSKVSCIHMDCFTPVRSVILSHFVLNLLSWTYCLYGWYHTPTRNTTSPPGVSTFYKWHAPARLPHRKEALHSGQISRSWLGFNALKHMPRTNWECYRIPLGVLHPCWEAHALERVTCSKRNAISPWVLRL